MKRPYLHHQPADHINLNVTIGSIIEKINELESRIGELQGLESKAMGAED